MALKSTGIGYTRRGAEQPPSMPEGYDYHGAFKSKGVGYGTKRILRDHLTSDNYEDSVVFDMRLFSRVLIHIKELNVNAVSYNLLACVDPSQWEALKSDQALAKAATAKEIVTDPYNWVKIQVKSTAPGSAGKVNAFISGKTP